VLASGTPTVATGPLSAKFSHLDQTSGYATGYTQENLTLLQNFVHVGRIFTIQP